MPASYRVTVVGSRRRLDLSLPDGVPVADLLLDLAEMLGEKADGVPAGWALVRVGGQALDPERDLTGQGVVEGPMLFLQDLTSPLPAPAIDDFAERVAVIVDAQPGRWTTAHAQTLLALGACVCVATAGGVSLMAGDAGERAATGVAGAALAALAGVGAARRLRRRGFGGLLVLAALPLWAAAGAGLASLAGGDAGGILASALGSVSAGAMVAILVAGDAIIVPSVGVMAATVVPALVLAGASLAGARPLAAWALLCLIGLAGPAFGPALAVRFAGIANPDPASMEARVRLGRRMAAALLIGNAIVLVVSSAVLVVSGGWFAYGLVAATAIAAAARARQFRFASEVAPLLAAGLAGLVLLEYPLIARLAIGPNGVGGAVAMLVVDGLVLFIVAAADAALGSWNLSPTVRRQLGRLELLATVATVPLALGVLGTYDAVARFAHGLT